MTGVATNCAEEWIHAHTISELSSQKLLYMFSIAYSNLVSKRWLRLKIAAGVSNKKAG
jgi:hypothetical protein